MEIKISKKNAIVAGISFGIGGIAGAVADMVYQKHHTPEDIIKEMKQSKEDLIQEQKYLDMKIRQNRDAVSEVAAERRKLENTKDKYQNEIKPEIEAKLRKELQDFIANAEKVYNKAEKLKAEAEHDKEIANLKLDLAKTLNESVTHTEKETKIIVKSADDEEGDI